MGRPKCAGSKTAASQRSNDKQMRISLQGGSMSVKRVYPDENEEPLELPEEPNNNEAHDHHDQPEVGEVEIIREDDGTEIRIISANLPSNNNSDGTQTAPEKHVSKKTKVTDSTFERWSEDVTQLLILPLHWVLLNILSHRIMHGI